MDENSGPETDHGGDGVRSLAERLAQYLAPLNEAARVVELRRFNSILSAEVVAYDEAWEMLLNELLRRNWGRPPSNN